MYFAGGYNGNDYGGGECFYHYLPGLEFSHLQLLDMNVEQKVWNFPFS